METNYESVPNQLLGLNEKTGKPPESRLTCGCKARGMVQQALKDDEARSRKRAIVNGLVDGNPPYSEAARKAAGLTWTCNLNFMEGDALMDSSAVPYYAIFNGVEHYAQVKTSVPGPESENWNRAINRRFSNMLKRWDSFDWEMQSISYHMRLHGIGPYIFPRRGDWRFRSLPTGMVLAPKGTKSRINESTKWLAARIKYSATELYSFISNEKSAEAYGWNVEAVKNAIKKSCTTPTPNGLNWRSTEWEYYQKLLKDNDIANSYTDFGDTQVAHMFVQEFPKDGARSGKISHFIVTEHPVYESSAGEKESDDKEFLLRRPNEYDSYAQCIGAFFQNMGNGDWHGVNGLADKAFKHLEISNRLKCRMVDGAFIESSLVLQPSNNQSKDKMALTQHGPVTYLPVGMEVRQSKLSGFLDGPITVDRLISNNLNNNIGLSRVVGREDGRGELPTATQINAQVTQGAQLSQGQMTLFYLDLDTLYNEMYRRASDSKTSDDEAKKFQQECLDDGVPIEALENVEWVRANRASGYGSPQMRWMNIQQLMPWVPRLPIQGQQNFQDDVIGATMGADKVDRYNPKSYIATEDDSIAANENATMLLGLSPIISTGQVDAAHLNIHLEAAGEYFGPIGEAIEAGGGEPQEMEQAFKYAQVLAAHCEQHLARLRQDPMAKDQVELFQLSLANIVAFSGKLRGAIIKARKQAQQAAQEQEQATALGALDQARVNQINTQTEMDRMKTLSKIENDKIKAVSSVTSKAALTVNDIRSKQAQTVTDAKAKQAEPTTNQ